LVEQVKNVLIVDFDVRTFDLKADLRDTLSLEDILVVEVLGASTGLPVRLVRVALQEMSGFNLAHLCEQVLEAAGK